MLQKSCLLAHLKLLLESWSTSLLDSLNTRLKAIFENLDFTSKTLSMIGCNNNFFVWFIPFSHSMSKLESPRTCREVIPLFATIFRRIQNAKNYSLLFVPTLVAYLKMIKCFPCKYRMAIAPHEY
jgi:hypothetical protein